MNDLSIIAEGCANIIQRIEDHAISNTACESVGELERYHDTLAQEVVNLAGMLRSAVQTIAQQESA